MIVTAVTMYVLSAMFWSVARCSKALDQKGIASLLAVFFLITGSVLLDVWMR